MKLVPLTGSPPMPTQPGVPPQQSVQQLPPGAILGPGGQVYYAAQGPSAQVNKEADRIKKKRQQRAAKRERQRGRRSSGSSKTIGSSSEEGSSALTSPSVTPDAKKEKKDKDKEKKEISDLKKEVSDLRRSQAEETEKKYADLLATRAGTVGEVKGTLMAGATGGGTIPLMPTMGGATTPNGRVSSSPPELPSSSRYGSARGGNVLAGGATHKSGCC